MDNLARPELQNDFGARLLDYIDQHGSSAAIAPLGKFLEQSSDPVALRSIAKDARPALVADIAHFMCISHGLHPGVVDHAASKILDDGARAWLVDAINGFAAERGLLNRLTVAAGPVRSRAGQDKVTSLLATQAKNFQMLATSDRRGCAAGAAIAFVLDWQQSRPILEMAGVILGVEPGVCNLPKRPACLDLSDLLGADEAARRAMMFGAEQLLGQQRGLWQILSARHAEFLALA